MFPSYVHHLVGLAVEVMWLGSMMKTLALNELTEKWFICKFWKRLIIKKETNLESINTLAYFSILVNDILNLYPNKPWELWQSNGNMQITTFCFVKLMATYQNNITGFLDLHYHVLIKTKSTRVKQAECSERYKKE